MPVAESNLFSVAIATVNPAWYNGIAVGEWRQISGTTSKPVPSPLPSGASNSPPGVARFNSWNGSAIDTSNSDMIIAAAGGHQDYAGNEVLRLNLEADAPSWSMPTTSSTNTPVNVTHYPDGKPTSRHDYNTSVYSAQRDRIIKISAPSIWVSDGGSRGTCDSWNPNTNLWEPALTIPTIPNMANGGQIAKAGTIDPNTGDMFILYVNSSSGNYEFRMLPHLGSAWNLMASPPLNATGDHDPVAYDSTRNQVLYINGNAFDRWNKATNVWTSGTISGNSISSQDGTSLIYVPAIDRYIHKATTSGGALNQINPATMAATTFTTTGGGSIGAPEVAGTYSRFNFVPRLRGAVLAQSYSTNVWFVRLY